MKVSTIFSSLYIFLIFISSTTAEPSFNGGPGCAGSGCHGSQAGIVTAEVLDNLQVRITVSGTTDKVGGELVGPDGNVVDVINSTNSNPFILTAPSAGNYTVNAGFKDPSRDYGSTAVVITLTDVNEQLLGIKPRAFELFSNYPNPFNPSTKIRFAIAQTVFTTLRIYSILGAEVATLIKEEKAPGVYEVNFDGLNLTSGTYLYKLEAGNYSMTKKMIMMK